MSYRPRVITPEMIDAGIDVLASMKPDDEPRRIVLLIIKAAFDIQKKSNDLILESKESNDG